MKSSTTIQERYIVFSKYFLKKLNNFHQLFRLLSSGIPHGFYFLFLSYLSFGHSSGRTMPVNKSRQDKNLPNRFDSHSRSFMPKKITIMQLILVSNSFQFISKIYKFLQIMQILYKIRPN